MGCIPHPIQARRAVATRICNGNPSLYFVSFNREGGPSEVAQQIEHEQDNEHKAESAAAPGSAPVSISAAAEEKNKDNNNED
jgi:hypothetical protein